MKYSSSGVLSTQITSDLQYYADASFHSTHVTAQHGSINATKITNLSLSVGQAHVNTWKLNQNILTDTAVFLNQKRANVCEHVHTLFSE